jgi:hypothetical protein
MSPLEMSIPAWKCDGRYSPNVEVTILPASVGHA